MLSASLQFIGTLGDCEPSNLIASAYCETSAGRCFATSGFRMMPSRKTFRASSGTEYDVVWLVMLVVISVVSMSREQ